MSDQVGEDSRNTRRFLCPKQYQKEKVWCSKRFCVPSLPGEGFVRSVRNDDSKHMEKFTELIWDHHPHTLLPGYNVTPEELSKLCGERLSSFHILWVLTKLNDLPGSHTMCFAIDSDCLTLYPHLQLQKLQGKLGHIHRLTFVLKVAKNPDGSVFIAEGDKPGFHWTVAVADLDRGIVTYCDSLGWSLPVNFVERVGEILRVFQKNDMKWSTFLAHKSSSPQAGHHTCGERCLNFPLQQGTDEGGVIAIIFAAVSMLREDVLIALTLPKSQGLRWFFHQPTRYSRYLRRSVIAWFMTGEIDLSFLPQQSDAQTPSTDTESSSAVKKVLKRKLETTGIPYHPAPLSSPSKAKNARHSVRKVTTKPNKGVNTACNLFRKFSWKSNKGEKNAANGGKAQADCLSEEERNRSSSIVAATEKCPQRTNLQSLLENSCTQDKQKLVGTETKSVTDNELRNKNTDTEQSTQDISNATNTKSQDKQNSDSSVPKVGSKRVAKPKDCPYCNKRLSSSSAVHKHIHLIHPNEDPRRPSPSYYCKLCGAGSVTIDQFSHHYKTVHGHDVHVQNASFSGFEQFETWKKDIEKKQLSRFIKDRGARSIRNTTYYYYSCQRSGFTKVTDRAPEQNRKKRAPKKQGSIKMSGKCPAFMRAFVSHAGGVRVEYSMDHVGHDLEIQELPLSQSLRSFIAEKATSRAEPQQLLDSISRHITGEDKPSSPNDSAINFNQYNTCHVQKHQSDKTSVDLWVDELSRLSDINPVIYYKPHGQSNSDGLKESDFLLCVQTAFQKELFKRHASKCVSADVACQITTVQQQDFLLISLTVVDDSNKAVPVAWAVSCGNMEQILKVFFSTVKKGSGIENLETEIFLSDLSPAFYSAWCAVFPQPARHLFCVSSVERAWKNNIIQQSQAPKDQATAYAYLKLLQREPNLKNFQKMLQGLLAYLQLKHPAFRDYFTANFVGEDREKLWARCHRLGADPKIFAKDLHHALQEVYIGCTRRRVDHLLIFLLRFARDKAVKQRGRLVKGTGGSRGREDRERHMAGATLTSRITRCGSAPFMQWLVPDGASSNVCCVQRALPLQQQCGCRQCCSLCSVCDHLFSCVCADYLLQGITCRHIHAVQMKLSSEDGHGGNGNLNYHAASGINDSALAETDILSDLSFTADSVDTCSFLNDTGVYENKTIEALRREALAELEEVKHLFMSTHSLPVLQAITQELKAAKDFAVRQTAQEILNNLEKGGKSHRGARSSNKKPKRPSKGCARKEEDRHERGEEEEHRASVAVDGIVENQPVVYSSGGYRTQQWFLCSSCSDWFLQDNVMVECGQQSICCPSCKAIMA